MRQSTDQNEGPLGVSGVKGINGSLGGESQPKALPDSVTRSLVEASPEQLGTYSTRGETVCIRIASHTHSSQFQPVCFQDTLSLTGGTACPRR